MNLYVEVCSMDKEPWRQTEDDYIIKFNKKIPISQLALTLGRSEQSVKERLKELLGEVDPVELKSETEPIKSKARKTQPRRRRILPKHLVPAFREFVCEIIEQNDAVRMAMRERLGERKVAT